MTQGGRSAIPFPGSPASLSVRDAVEAFLARDFSPNTLRNFRSDLGGFRESFGDRPAASIMPEEVRAYLDGLRTRDGDEVAAETHNRHFGTIGNLFSWLQFQGEIQVNPMLRLERRRVNGRLPQPLTREQLETFFDRITELRERALFSLLHKSGLRIEEALSLDIEDVNFETGTLRIQGKGGQERVGYLSEETAQLLRRYLRSREQPRLGPLFVSRQGRLSYQMAWKLFRDNSEGMTKPDGRPVTIHQLRHSFGSERAGEIDPLILRDLMGHRSIQTTLRYAQVNAERTREAFQEFDRRHAPRSAKRRRKVDAR